VVNKIGTFGLGLGAKEVGVPLTCVCESAKFLPDIASFKELNMLQPEEQLYRNGENVIRPKRLEIKNIYFDNTPLAQFNGFLTENGLIGISEVKSKIEGIKIMAELMNGKVQ
jgi:translation initiation factor 2B subunit (eIF-2B alpha/beta/delta family)